MCLNPGYTLNSKVEVSQKEKNEYHILTHKCGILKNGINDLTCKAEIDTKTWRTNVQISSREGGMNLDIGIDIYTLLIPCVK